ncbi:MAG: ribonuclease D [Rhodobiaceae bacterium]|nr:ribonuclease D [Rhodobiaceae bacterium]
MDIPALPVAETEPITETEDLERFCAEVADEPFVTVDTEFIRETTYWPRLCLIQIAGRDRAVTVDPLADDLDLTAFFDLMANEEVLKVFHAARQDLEIIWNLGRLIPAPVFDTQVAAMVCGFGDSISYEQLIQRISRAQIDKSSRFTDWSRRPLTQKQIHYALSDVTHLRTAYMALTASLDEQNRTEWVREEMAVLTSPETYDIQPEDAWKRLKMRVKKPRELAVMIEVAAWREREAQTRNMPRGRIMKDDAIYEIAVQHPTDAEALSKLRAVPRGYERSRHADGLIEAVKAGLAMEQDRIPRIQRNQAPPEGTGAVVDMLKVLLKAVSEEDGVAARIIATVDDLSRIAIDDEAPVPALSGWRRELFGERALQLKRGELALVVKNGKVRVRKT